MPTINLPLIKGSGISKSSKYIDKFPVNLVVIPRDTGNGNYYLRSFPGLVKSSNAEGRSYAAEYNDVVQKEYRLIGSDLYEDGVSVQSGLSPQLSNTAHTASNQAFISGGMVKYWKDGKLYSLDNWKEGENFVTYPDYKFIASFDGEHAITIPDFVVDGESVFLAVLDSALEYDFNLLYGEKYVNSIQYTYQLFFDKSDGKLYEIIKTDGAETRKDELADLNSENLNVGVTINSTVNENITIAVQRVGGANAKYFRGTIETFSLTPLVGDTEPQSYTTIKEVERDSGEKPPFPTDKEIVNLLDDTVTAKLDSGMIWKSYKEQGEPTKSGATSIDLGGFIDLDRFDSRFVLLKKDSMVPTAISIGANGDESTDPEHRPDFAVNSIVQRSDPDKNMAIRSYQGKYVAVFGRNTVEFFQLTGDVNTVFAPIRNLLCPAGIVATGAVCHFMGAFAAIGSTKGGSLQVMMIQPGGAKKISTSEVDRKIMNYTEEQLQDVFVESFLRENHEFLVIHLPDETLLYDGASGIWTELCTGYGFNRREYASRHFLYNQKLGFTVKSKGEISLLDDSVSSQGGLTQEFIVYSPMVEVVKGRGMVPLFGLTFDTIPGHVNQIQTAFVSLSKDGLTFGEEELRLQYNNPKEYMSKIVVDSVGSIQHNVAFKMRVMSTEPVVFSDFSVRVGYE